MAGPMTTAGRTASIGRAPRGPKVNARIGLLAATLMLAAAAGAESDATALDSVEELLAAARTARADLLAPSDFAAAERELDAARKLVAEGGKSEAVERRLARATDAIAAAMAAAEIALPVIDKALAARDAAAAAGADTLAGEPYARAERDFREAVDKMARGNEQMARVKAADAERRFRDAELLAIETDVLGAARELIAGVVDATGEAWAPTSLAHAREKLAAAEETLRTDRQRRSEAEALAAAASAWARRAASITEAAKGAATNSGAYEALVLAIEVEVRAIGAALGQETDLGDDTALELRAAGEQIQSGIEALQSEQESLARDLTAATQEIERLRAKERGLSAELAVQREREERLRRIRELFTPDEAVLVREGGRLILRLKGVNFAEGESAILPASYPLLGKVMRAIRDLPGAAITIEGHTDSKGDEQKNLALSEARAQAVRTYLEANMDLSDRLVTTLGKGEMVPIASNETEAGRAQNRRIDLVIDARVLLGE